MDDPVETPQLLLFLFGEQAGQAQRGISDRLSRWCQAFEAWLADRKCNYHQGAFALALQNWQRLLGQHRKMPWELTVQDFEQHAAWMEAQGYALSTIAHGLGILAGFYRWCDEKQIDPQCSSGFNPALEARRPKIRRYARAQVLSQGEVERLLDIIQRDKSPLGQRNYALYLARLRLGVPLRYLQRLRWGQIEEEGKRAWVRWRTDGERVQLPGEVWEALQDWRAACGRPAAGGRRPPGRPLSRMRADESSESDYVFTPLADPFRDQERGWAKGKYLSTDAILANLKVYGRSAGIDEQKLNLLVLRCTAIRLRLEPGAHLAESTDLHEMQTFLDSHTDTSVTKFRLKHVSLLPQVSSLPPQAPGQGQPPRHKPHIFQDGEVYKHGFYANSQPVEAVRAILREDLHGVEQEIIGLRTLARGLLELQGQTRSGKELAQLAAAYTLTAERLAKMIQAEKRQAGTRPEQRGDADRWVEDCLAMLDQIMADNGMSPLSPKFRADALGAGPELATEARRLVEEVASTRLVLRNTLRLAQAAAQQGALAEYIHLADIYSIGCNRLMLLLRAGEGEQGQLEASVRQFMDEILSDLQATWSVE